MLSTPEARPAGAALHHRSGSKAAAERTRRGRKRCPTANSTAAATTSCKTAFGSTRSSSAPATRPGTDQSPSDSTSRPRGCGRRPSAASTRTSTTTPVATMVLTASTGPTSTASTGALSKANPKPVEVCRAALNTSTAAINAVSPLIRSGLTPKGPIDAESSATLQGKPGSADPGTRSIRRSCRVERTVRPA